MQFKSHTREEVETAALRGEKIWRLDTQNAGEDDVLIGGREAVERDMFDKFDAPWEGLQDLGWTLEDVTDMILMGSAKSGYEIEEECEAYDEC